MAQAIKHPTLDFDSVHDLMVHGIEPCVGFCTDMTAWSPLRILSLTLSVSAPPLLELPLSLAK